jgi:hypothetical protein
MDEVDWRLKATGLVDKDTTLPWNGHKVRKGDRIKLVSQVNLPKNKILTVPVPSLTALYISNAEKAWKDYRDIRVSHKIDSSIKSEVSFKTDSAAFDAIELIATSVISAFTAVESFCNESIPENHEYWHNRNSDVILEKSDKKGIERHFTTSAKLNEILPSIYDVEPPKGRNPVWASYRALKKTRDSLIHVKSHETRSVGIDKSNLWDQLFKLEKPHLMAKDVFTWYLKGNSNNPPWYEKYPR